MSATGDLDAISPIRVDFLRMSSYFGRIQMSTFGLSNLAAYWWRSCLLSPGLGFACTGQCRVYKLLRSQWATSSGVAEKSQLSLFNDTREPKLFCHGVVLSYSAVYYGTCLLSLLSPRFSFQMTLFVGMGRASGPCFQKNLGNEVVFALLPNSSIPLASYAFFFFSFFFLLKICLALPFLGGNITT